MNSTQRKDNYYSEYKIIDWENNILINRLLNLNRKISVQDDNLSFERNEKDVKYI
jgi:hypothetical protein